MRTRYTLVLCLAATLGCSSKPTLVPLSGKVTFKGQPVPAGWISFTPDVGAGNKGQVMVFQIKDGVYDARTTDPPGLAPGQYLIKIAGFDGKRIPLFGQGKQIFNPVDDKFTVTTDTPTKDFVVPESAGKNIRYEPTADT